MTVRNLEYLFRPRSIAVIAEPEEPSRYAEVVLANLAAAFPGKVTFSTTRKPSFFSLISALHLVDLPETPDLAIVCATLDRVPEIIRQLAARGTHAAIVGPWRWRRMGGSQVLAARKAILEAARPTLLRVLGPGSGGLAVPAGGISANTSPVPIRAGTIALVGQSTAVMAAILERADSRGIGFSTVVHLGSSIDVDLADVLDWLAADSDTRAVLVHFDTLPDGRKFMSAARAVARHKPVVCIRTPRWENGRAAADPLSTVAVEDAAIRRAGWVRIETLADLLDAVEALARARPTFGERLLIVGNGHGLGQIAADTLRQRGGQLGELSAAVAGRLGELLPSRKPPGNPVALPADATPATWASVLGALLAEPNSDSLLTVCSPSPFARGDAVAAAICEVARDSPRNVFTCWVGGSGMHSAQELAAKGGLFSHDSPERAIAVFLGVQHYFRNRRLLLQMPPSVAEGIAPDLEIAGALIRHALAARTTELSPAQIRGLLQAYGIAAPESPFAANIDAAIAIAEKIGYPVDLALVLGKDHAFKTMAPGLRSPAEIRLAVRSLRAQAHAANPVWRIGGYRLRASVARSGAPPLRLGVVEDALFGPVFFLAPALAAGKGSTNAIAALPPLNAPLAHDFVARSAFVAELPREQRDPLVVAVSKLLVALSQLMSDFDAIAAIDLEPLLVERSGVIVGDGRVRLAGYERYAAGRRAQGLRRFAIRPYPKELERCVHWRGRQILIRPVRPEDEPMLGELLNSLAPEDSRMRFFDSLRNLPRNRLARFSQIDYDREMALLAVDRHEEGRMEALGEVRAVADPDGTVADFAIVVASALKGQGLGRLLLQELIDYCRRRGIGQLRGQTLAGNLRMQQLASTLGFSITAGSDRGTTDLSLVLKDDA